MTKQKHIRDQKVEFGGSLLIGKRRRRRPLSAKLPTHLVLKAVRSDLLLRRQSTIRHTLFFYGTKFGIKIYECGIHADHIHLAIRTPNRVLYVRWIRSVASVLVQRIGGLSWKFRPYTRLANWGRPFLRLKKYIQRNQREGDALLAAHELYERFLEQILKPYVIVDPSPDP